MSFTQLGYVTVGVSNIAAWKEFGTDMLGLQVGGESDDELLLRNDWWTYRIRAVKSDADDLLALGWCVPDEKSLNDFQKKLAGKGAETVWGTAEEAAERKVKGFFSVKDPDGIVNEIFFGPHLSPGHHFNSPLPISGFETGDEGMGHVGLWVDDVNRSVEFYRDLLGMKVTDWAESPRLYASFLRCNRRQHSLALIQMPAPGALPKRLHHIEMEYLDMDDVGRAYDRAEDRQIVMATMGKHPAEQALSFYMFSPSGFGFELSWGGIKIPDDSWPETWHDDKAYWGHKFIGLGKKAVDITEH